MINTYLFQGNPKNYDMNSYLATHPYIYWRCPSYQDKIQIGDNAILWRAGKDAGMIAIGEIVEAPTSASTIKFPELLGQHYWAEDEIDVNDIKVGIAISELKLNVDVHSLSRQYFKTDPVVSKHRIITNPTGTVFQIEDTIANAMLTAWSNSTVPDAEMDEFIPNKVKDYEGSYRYVLHCTKDESVQLRYATQKLSIS